MIALVMRNNAAATSLFFSVNKGELLRCSCSYNVIGKVVMLGRDSTTIMACTTRASLSKTQLLISGL